MPGVYDACGSLSAGSVALKPRDQVSYMRKLAHIYTLFTNLDLYKLSGSFVFKSTDVLDNKCNAPVDKSGVYLVYSLSKGETDLVYIGSSGKMMQNGGIRVRKGGGLWDRITNGKQFKAERRDSWPQKMNTEHIDALTVYWHVTVDDTTRHIPLYVEGVLIQKYYARYHCLPKWNTAF